MLLRKQTAYDQTLEAVMTFTPSRTGYEAGMVLWWNQYSYATIGVALVELSGGERVHTVTTRCPQGQASVISASDSQIPSALCITKAHPRHEH